MIKIQLDNPEDFLIYRYGTGGTVEITGIAVMSERGKGRGRALLIKLIKELDDKALNLYALARADNGLAREFYLRVGFKMAALIRNFYLDSEQQGAAMYCLDVKPATRDQLLTRLEHENRKYCI